MDKPLKILIIRNDHIGDMVLSTQIFREIKKHIPSSEITVICSKTNKQIIEKNKNIDKIIEFEIPKHNFKTILNFVKMSFKIKRMKFDYGIDLRGSVMNSLFLLYLPRIKNRISRIDWYKNISLFLTKSIKPNPKKHIIEQNLELVNKGLDINSKNFSPEIITDSEDEKRVNQFLKNNQLKKYICILPETRNILQKWNIKNFDLLIKWINQKYPSYKILLIGTSEGKKEIELLMKNKNIKSLIDSNLRVMSLLFKKSACVIAQDGGPMHIAWVSNSNLIALLGPLNLTLLKPLNSIIIHHKLKCNPCEKILSKCPIELGKRCIDLISVEEVKRTVEEILK